MTFLWRVLPFACNEVYHQYRNWASREQKRLLQYAFEKRMALFVWWLIFKKPWLNQAKTVPIVHNWLNSAWKSTCCKPGFEHGIPFDVFWWRIFLNYYCFLLAWLVSATTKWHHSDTRHFSSKDGSFCWNEWQSSHFLPWWCLAYEMRHLWRSFTSYECNALHSPTTWNASECWEEQILCGNYQASWMLTKANWISISAKAHHGHKENLAFYWINELLQGTCSKSCWYIGTHHFPDSEGCQIHLRRKVGVAFDKNDVPWLKQNVWFLSKCKWSLCQCCGYKGSKCT